MINMIEHNDPYVSLTNNDLLDENYLEGVVDHQVCHFPDKCKHKKGQR